MSKKHYAKDSYSAGEELDRFMTGGKKIKKDNSTREGLITAFIGLAFLIFLLLLAW